MSAHERYQFGEFVLERSQHRVRRLDGRTLHLTPRLFSALLLFVEHPGELLDRDTMMRALWPDLVVEENNLSQSISSLRRLLGDNGKDCRYIETVPRRGFRFIADVAALPISPPNSASQARGAPLPASARGRTTLAVLPFVPLSTLSRDDLLPLGMADSLISRLSTVPGLVVRSAGSLRRYAGPDREPMAAARELDVRWVIDGSLQRNGDKLRVTARLLSVPDGDAAWSGQFDEEFTDVFEMQDAISSRVAVVLAPLLNAGTGGGISPAQAPTEQGGSHDANAYQLYLAARQHSQGVRADGLLKSIGLYEKALSIDPRYALAYTGQAESYRRMLFGADKVPSEVFAPYRKAVLKALALAPGLAEAHAQLGWIHFWYDFDWPKAERAFREALSLNPNVVGAHFGLGFLLLTLDRADEGIDHVRWARELDPMSLIINTMEACFLLDMGRHEEAALRLARVFELEPNFWVAHLSQSLFHIADGRNDLAIESLERANRLTDQSTQAAAMLGMQLARLGRPAEARKILDRFRSLEQSRYVPPTSLAAVYAALGEVEPALDELERAWAARDTRLVYLKDDRRWAGLRGHPRFSALLVRMKLDAYGPGTTGP
jgi:DNA-binding winged helix-turn-helix (wHTH) protein/tetratricopeptide (TPR) repeat protein